jgi:hypothetical protein
MLVIEYTLLHKEKGLVMEQADRLIVRIEEARNVLEEEVRKAKHISPTLHQACIEAGVVLDDALAVLVHLRQICDEFIQTEPDTQLKLKY